MNVLDEIKNIRQWLAEINRLLLGVRRTAVGGGEANTASNQGAGGVGLYNAKVGVDLQFRNINAASNKIIVALDAPNKEVDIDVDPSKIDLGDLGDVSAAAPNDNDVLTWDAGASEWAPEVGGGAGGGAENPWAHRRAGRCYTTWDFYYATTFAITRDNLYAYPFIVPVTQSFDRILVAVSTAQVNGVCRIGIYSDSGVYPDALVLDSGEIDCSGAGYKAVVINEELTAGLYWLVINHDGNANVTFRCMDYNITYPMSWFAILGKSGTNWVTPPHTHWKVSEAYGALPDPFTGGATMINNENLVAIHLRKA